MEPVPPSVAADSYRALHRFDNDDANKAARWECIHAPNTANTCSFSPHGLALAVATTKGEVFVWDMHGTSRPKAGVLRLPDEPLVLAIKELEGQTEAAAAAQSVSGVAPGAAELPVSIITPLRSTGVRPFQSITCLGWSASGRLLFGGTTGGLVAVWDLCSPDPAAAELPLAVFKLPYPPRSIKPHPNDPTVLLIVTWTGMPYIVQWLMSGPSDSVSSPVTSSSRRVQHASDCGSSAAPSEPSSPFPLDCLYRLNRSTNSSTAQEPLPFIRAGYAWRLPEMLLPPPRQKKAKLAYLKGAPVLRVDACFRPNDGRQLFLATSRGDVVQLGLILPSLAATTPRVVRLAHTGPAVLGPPLGVSPPEIHHSRHGPYLGVTMRSGIVCLSSEGGLAVVDRGYSEPVDNTPLVSCRFSSKDKYIVALPHERSGHMAGGVYFFRRGVLGSFKLRLGPAGGIASFDCHPRLGIFVGVTVRSQVYILAPALHAVFPGPMFPPFFVMTLANKEYPEPEDEFDLVDASGRFRYHDRGSGMEGRGEPLFLGGGDAPQVKPVVVQAPLETVAALPPVNILSDVGTLSRVVKQTQAQLLSVSPSASLAHPPATSSVLLHGGVEIDLAAVPDVASLSPHIHQWWAVKDEVLGTQTTGQDAAGAGGGASGGGGQAAGTSGSGGSKSNKGGSSKKKPTTKGGGDMVDEGELTSPVAAGGSVEEESGPSAQPAALEDMLLARLQPLPEGTVIDADAGIPADLLGLDTTAHIAFDLLPVTTPSGAPPLAYLLPCKAPPGADVATAEEGGLGGQLITGAAALPPAQVPLSHRLHALLQLQPIPGIWSGLAAVNWAELPALAATVAAGAAATGPFAPAVAAATVAALASSPTFAAPSSPRAVTAYLREHVLSALPALTVTPGWRSGELECGAGTALADAVAHALALLQQEWRLVKLQTLSTEPAAEAEAREATAATAKPTAAVGELTEAVENAARAYLSSVTGATGAPVLPHASIPRREPAQQLPADASPEPLAKRARLA